MRKYEIVEGITILSAVFMLVAVFFFPYIYSDYNEVIDKDTYYNEVIDKDTLIISGDKGDITCFTQTGLNERIEEEQKCVFKDKCVSGYYTNKCDLIITEQNIFEELKADCR